MTGVPVGLSEEQIAGIRFDDKGLVAAIAQDHATRDVLRLAWDERRGAAKDAHDGPYVVLEQEPTEILVLGRDLGRSSVGPGCCLRLRRGAHHRRPGGSRGVPHRRLDLFPPQVRRLANVTCAGPGEDSRSVAKLSTRDVDARVNTRPRPC